LQIACVADPPGSLHAHRLFEVEFVCIAAQDHPSIQGSLDMPAYLAASHVTLSFGQGHIPYIIERDLDEQLAADGLIRRKSLEISSLLAIPDIVARTEMIATIPIELALHAASHQPIQVLPLPFRRPPCAISMLWHPRSHRDPAHEWLRTTIKRVSCSDRASTTRRVST
jgi:DNA-binding transcriptional LysR family regulator